MRISDWSSDVCSSDLTRISGFSRIEDTGGVVTFPPITAESDYTDYMPNVSARIGFTDELQLRLAYTQTRTRPNFFDLRPNLSLGQPVILAPGDPCLDDPTTEECVERSEEHTYELQSLMRNPYAVFCQKKKNDKRNDHEHKIYTHHTQHELLPPNNDRRPVQNPP